MSVLGSSPLGRAPLGGRGGVMGSQLRGLTLRIGPVDATPFLVVRSWHLREELNGRDDASFTLLTRDAWFPQEGEEVRLTLDGARLFGGTVHGVEAEFLTVASRVDAMTAPVLIQVRCVDYNQLADRFVVTEVYEGVTAGAILRALVEKYLGDDGVSAAGIQDGPTLAKVAFPSIMLSQCFDAVAELIGYHWNIDDYKTFVFAPFRPTETAIVIDATNPNYRHIRRRTTRNQFRNVQYVDGGYFLTDVRGEEFVLDGRETTKSVGFAIHSLKKVWVDNVEQTIGIRGVDEGKQWYWNKGEPAVSQDLDEPRWPAGSVLKVQYQGRYQAPSVVEDPAAIDARRTIEGGSGRYEHIVRDSSLEGDALVTEKGLGLLRRFASIDKELSFETERDDFAVGQAIELDVPRLGVNHERFLVTGLDTSSLVTKRRFQVHVTSGELKGTSNEFFKKLFASGQPLTFREDDIVNKIVVESDAVTMSDTLTAASAAYAAAVCGTAVIGECEL